VRKLVLTHFREKSVSLMRSVEATVRKDYSGEIVLGEDLMEVNI
jgi:ribonuclease BN (tRNA processing enzyme)